jgi:hypothetical protein
MPCARGAAPGFDCAVALLTRKRLRAATALAVLTGVLATAAIAAADGTAAAR